MQGAWNGLVRIFCRFSLKAVAAACEAWSCALDANRLLRSAAFMRLLQDGRVVVQADIGEANVGDLFFTRRGGECSASLVTQLPLYFLMCVSHKTPYK